MKQNDIVKASTLIRNGKQFKTKIILNPSEPEISFEININKVNFINNYNENNEQISFYNSKISQSNDLSKKSIGNKSIISKNSNQSENRKTIINIYFDFLFRGQNWR